MCQSYIFSWKASEDQEHYSRYQNGQYLEFEKSYKYQGVTEGDVIQHSSMKEKIWKECFWRVWSVMRSELNACNRMDAINSLALLVVTYSFTMINLSFTEVKKFDSKIRKLLAMHRMHHPKSNVNRLCLPRKEVERGLAQLELSIKASIIGMDTHLNTTIDSMLKFAQNTRKINVCTVLLAMRKNIQMRSTLALTIFLKVLHLRKKKNIETQVKTKSINELKEGWKDKPLHGKYPIFL